jgi:hypothetical protein
VDNSTGYPQLAVCLWTSCGQLRGARWPVGGVRVTGIARTAFDCLQILPGSEALPLLGRALQKRWIMLPDLVRRVRIAGADRRPTRSCGLPGRT